MQHPWLGSALPLSALLIGVASAADHAEAPGTQADPAADINDLYVWHDGGTLTTVLSFNPRLTGADTVGYDSDLLYTIHIDTNEDGVSDTDIYVRFGQNGSGAWGMQVENLPGADGTVVGAVETSLTSGAAKAWVGLADDPFFFDLQGYIDTLNTGTIAFTKADDFAGFNVGAIVLEMDIASFAGTDKTFHVWATSARR